MKLPLIVESSARCPECSGGDITIEVSRPNPQIREMRRERHCPSCAHAWTETKIITPNIEED